MKKYRKISIEVEAIQWDGKNTDSIITWCNGFAKHEDFLDGSHYLVIQTLETNKELQTRHAANVGDWIIKGIDGEFYPCKPYIFDVIYE